ncbi:MAG: tetratricopeptide repeat-containing protein kinase family protein, partial [Dokdonella sp.]
TLTGTGVRVFSPAYAAPEQILGELSGTATDVYALGVLLFELLTGHTPHRRTSRDPLQLAYELERETTERVSQMLARNAMAEASGGFDRKRMIRVVSGDLDLIVATATQRDPRRRYTTAAAFAEDLRRWLDGRPIAARPDSRRYRMGRFVRRHRFGVAAAAFIALALVGGLGIAVWQANIARSEARRADGERDLARQQLARAERVKEFVLALFREQDPASRASVLARTPPELIREGIAQVDATLAAEPALQADLLRDLGEIQSSLGEREAGKATLQRAWELHKTLSGEDSGPAAEALAAYATASMVAGDMTAAEPMLRTAIANLLKTRGENHPKTGQAKTALARVAMFAGRNDEALLLAEQALQIVIDSAGKESPQVAPVMHLVSVIQSSLSRYDESLSTAREALRIVEASSGAMHVRTIPLHSQISDVLRNQRSFDDSLQHLDSALRIARTQLPPRHPILGALLTRQGDQLRRMRRFAEAERAFAEAISLFAGSRSGELAQIMQNYGTLAVAEGRADLAVERYRESVALFRQASGESTFTWMTTLLLADAMASAGSLNEAARTGDEATAALARMTTPDSYESAFAATVVGRLRFRQGRYEEAVVLHRHALTVLAPSYGEDHVETAESRTFLARSLAASADPASREEAAALIEKVLPIVEAALNKQGLLADVFLVRAQLRFDANDPSGARADLERAEAATAMDASDQVAQQRRARQLRERIAKATAAPTLAGRSRN